MCLVNPASCAFSQKEAPRFRATNQKRSKNPGRAKQCRGLLQLTPPSRELKKEGQKKSSAIERRYTRKKFLMPC